MTDNKQVAQALKDTVKTLYQDDKCAEMGWETDKPTIVVALREAVNQLQYQNFSEGVDMIVDAHSLYELADEVEVL
jgi:hypothetical protein